MRKTFRWSFSILALNLMATVAIAGGGGAQNYQVASCSGTLEDGSAVAVKILRNEASGRLTGAVEVAGREWPGQGWALDFDYLDDTPQFAPDKMEYALKSDLTYAANAGRYYAMYIYTDKETRTATGKQFFFMYEKRLPSQSTQLDCVGKMQ